MYCGRGRSFAVTWVLLSCCNRIFGLRGIGPAAEPKTTAVMRERHKAEREEKPDDVKRLSKRFGMLHGLSSLANLIGLGLAHCHLWHVASRLQV